MGPLDRLKAFFKKLNPFSKQDGKKVVAELLKNPIKLRELMMQKKVGEGAICFFEYSPKDRVNVWDYKPLIIVLGVSRNYVLGCNFHWINMEDRIALIEQIIKVNKKGFSINTPLKFTYDDLKPLLTQPRYRNCIHLYIMSRMSSHGVVVDPKYLLDIARLKLEHFQGSAKALQTWRAKNLIFK